MWVAPFVPGVGNVYTEVLAVLEGGVLISVAYSAGLGAGGFGGAGGVAQRDSLRSIDKSNDPQAGAHSHTRDFRVCCY